MGHDWTCGVFPYLAKIFTSLDFIHEGFLQVVHWSMDHPVNRRLPYKTPNFLHVWNPHLCTFYESSTLLRPVNGLVGHFILRNIFPLLKFSSTSFVYGSWTWLRELTLVILNSTFLYFLGSSTKDRYSCVIFSNNYNVNIYFIPILTTFLYGITTKYFMIIFNLMPPLFTFQKECTDTTLLGHVLVGCII